MVVRFLYDKYVKAGKGKLYSCFVDLRKAFDTVHRSKMFYMLLSEYKIGGKFLRVVMDMYFGNQIHVKTSGGLIEPFFTHVGVKQGCVLSPKFFNLFLNGIPGLFDESCDPVQLSNRNLNVLMWADDLFLVSTSHTGLRECIARTAKHFDQLGLSVNTSKTKILIFNGRGLKLDNDPNHCFSIGGNVLEVVSEYKYLGFIIKPSGIITAGVDALYSKASRAWFSISNLVYTNKKMPYKRILNLFHSLVTSIGLYACEFWFPFSLSKKQLESKFSSIKAWENLRAETLHQKACRMVLSVGRQTSRLAVLGELGEFPLHCKALTYTFKYEWHIINRNSTDSILNAAFTEMNSMASEGKDCWLLRVNKLRALLDVPIVPHYLNPGTVGKQLSKCFKSHFEMFWLDSINQVDKKKCTCPLDHNKLRLYKQFKGSFTAEPYIENVRNRNQRSFLTRFRLSNHRLRIETGRWTVPKTVLGERTCRYCSSGSVDTELHAITECSLTIENRSILYAILSSRDFQFGSLSNELKLNYILCPTNAINAKLVNKYLSLLVDTRNWVDKGKPDSGVGFLSLGVGGIKVTHQTGGED